MDATAPRETRYLFRIGLLIFVVTVAIGLFNGFHLVQLSRAVLLTHLHAGTLGWITVGAFAAAFWAFGGGDEKGSRQARNMAVAFTIWVPLYVLAFLSGNFVLRAIFGVPVLGMILAFAGVLAARLGKVGVSTPKLGMILAFTVLVIGSTLGVLLQIELATNGKFLPDNAVSGHAAAQVGGYLALVAVSIIDWRLAGTNRLSAAGIVQVVFLFLGGILVAAGALFNVPPLLGTFIPLDLIALGIFLVRIGPRVAGAAWTSRGGSRHYAIAVPWLVANLLTLIYAVIQVISKGIDAAPSNIFVAADHAIFIGVMTNVIFGMIQDATKDQAATWAWADDVVFWVMNLALAGFFTVLWLNQPSYEKFFVPFQGVAILIGIVAYSIRLANSKSSPAPNPT